MNTEMEALAAAAAEADALAGVAPAAEGQGGPAGAAGPDYGTEAAQAVGVFADLLAAYAPGTATIWTAEARQRTAAALGPVMEKHGWTMAGLPPELTLAVVAGPLLWQSARVVAAQVQYDRARAAQAASGGVVIDTPAKDATGQAAEPAHGNVDMTGMGEARQALYEQGGQ